MINFATSIGTLSPAAASALTDSSGIAIIDITAGLAPGAGTATATFGSLSDTVSFSTSGDELDATVLNIALVFSGSNVITSSGPGSLVATVTDSQGNVASNEVVTFTVGNALIGSISPISGTALSNGTGVATISLLPGSESGASEVTATVLRGGQVYSDTATFTTSLSNVAIGLCSDSDADGIGDAGGTFTEGDLDLDFATISSRGSAIVTAFLVENGVDGGLCTDLLNQPETVAFSSSCTGTTPPQAALDASITATDGIATSIYRGAGCSGLDRITATIESGAQAIVNISVDPAEIGAIQFVSVSEVTLAISGTGGADRAESSAITFRVLDKFGSAASSKKVAFELLQNVGGMSLDNALADGNFAVSNGDGDVVVTLISGSIPATVRVRAWLLNDDAVLGSATAADIFADAITGLRINNVSDLITVSSALPVQGSLVLALDNHKPEAFRFNGRTVNVTAFATDRFNHKVPDGSNVFFYTEYGQIDASCQVDDGECSVTWKSVNQTPAPADQRVTILATMVGEERFTDLNGDGRFDLGDEAAFWASTNELGEAFVDNDELGTHDAGEFFLDRDSSGTYTAAVVGTPLFSGVMCDGATIASGHCADAVDVRDEEVLMTIDTISELTITGVPATIAAPSTVTFTVTDSNGNPPPTGATVTVTTTNGTASPTSFSVGDGFGVFTRSFNVSADTTSSAGTLTITVGVPLGVETSSAFAVVD